tara:strand:- start:3668 stop:4543 length:876 start_codon:yes stop_codon:yes gene_type:complete
MKCYYCGSNEHSKVDGKIRDRDQQDNISIVKCKSCGLISLDDTNHIHDTFYENSNMLEGKAFLGTGYKAWAKINETDNNRRLAAFEKDIINKDILDFGCGTGDFLKKARKYASSVSAVEVDEGLKENLESIENLTLYTSLEEIEKDKKYDVIFLFHVLEHIKDPEKLLRSLARRLTKDGKIIIEVPNADDALLTLYDCESYKNFYYWKCHLFYYTAKTLQDVCLKSDLSIDYVKQVQRYPISNHLAWIRYGKPGGHHILNYLDSDILSKEYESRLASIGKCDTLIARVKNA